MHRRARAGGLGRMRDYGKRQAEVPNPYAPPQVRYGIFICLFAYLLIYICVCVCGLLGGVAGADAGLWEAAGEVPNPYASPQVGI